MFIRIMTIDDYPGAYQLWLDTPGMGLNTTDDSPQGIAVYLSRNPRTCFVAEQDGEIAGVIMSGHDGRRGFIYHTAVRHDLRGQGLGRALLDKAMAALEDEGICKVALVVYVKNETGNAFWQQCGFTTREDLVYRNKNIREIQVIDT